MSCLHHVTQYIIALCRSISSSNILTLFRLLDRQLAELQDRCDQLQAEAREVQELRTRISRVEKEARQSEDDLRAVSRLLIILDAINIVNYFCTFFMCVYL